ncbi:hypothetical protein [Kitasatospora purpeofusca]|uniref:hypothetical protein n=1 Tax=Kitasatospora purpeofusca TaxID=67352 RepID=UPI003F4A929A
MTPKRPGAASADLDTFVLVATGEQLARAVWATYGDRIRATAGPVARSIATGARTAASPTTAATGSSRTTR